MLSDSTTTAIPTATACMVMRILAHFDSATAMDLAEGLSWYHDAEALARELADQHGYTVEQTAGVIAALSPRTRWPTNAASARTMVIAAAAGFSKPPRLPGYCANRDKAWRILTSGKPVGDILGGPKVLSFWRNILGDTNAVTVDIWAARAAEAHHFDARKAITGKRYERIADAYRLAAQARNVTPRDMQAAVWINERRVDAGQLFNWEKEF